MGLCGFTQPSVLCMLGHRWRLTNFGKINSVGVVSSIASGKKKTLKNKKNYGHIYIQIHVYMI